MTKKTAKPAVNAATNRDSRTRAEEIEFVPDTTTMVAEGGAEKGDSVWDALRKEMESQGNPRMVKGRMVRDLEIEVK